MNIENSDQFGNYLIHGIDEIVLPEAVSLWPSTPGWKLLALALMAYASLKLVRFVRRWWHDRYRRAALSRLAGLAPGQQLAELPFLLKATALHAYPRTQVAALSGERWLEFLDQHCPEISFQGETGQQLLQIAYLPQPRWQIDEAQASRLIAQSRTWIERHV